MSRRTPVLLACTALCASASFTAMLPLAPAQAAAAPATLTIASNAPALRAGQVLTLSGQLTSGGVAKPDASVLLLGRTGGTTTERTLADLATDSQGRLVYQLRPVRNTAYRFAYAGDSSTGAVRSAATVSRVIPTVVAAANRRSAGTGDPVTVTGGLSPRIPSVPVTLQRRIGNGSWAVVASSRTGSTGAYSFRWKAGAEGTQALRVGIQANAAYEASTSTALPLTVAGNLASGASGPRVVALQQRLASLKYDLGAVDGKFGSNTHHALVAFQKGQRLPRTGVYDVATRERLAAPRALTVRYPARGRAVEVDLSRQILIMSEGGRVSRVIDVSTGNNEYFTSEGVRSLAYTPLGRFTVERKIDGVRTARLGKLYRPAYFHQGWAIHGSSSVPTYPASHGCVRVTNATMDRIFGLLTIGTPVAVYAR